MFREINDFSLFRLFMLFLQGNIPIVPFHISQKIGQPFDRRGIQDVLWTYGKEHLFGQ